MCKSTIVGREYEIRKLNELYDSKDASLVNGFDFDKGARVVTDESFL